MNEIEKLSIDSDVIAQVKDLTVALNEVIDAVNILNKQRMKWLSKKNK